MLVNNIDLTEGLYALPYLCISSLLSIDILLLNLLKLKLCTFPWLMLTRHLGNTGISTILVWRISPSPPPMSQGEAPECLKRKTNKQLPPFTFTLPPTKRPKLFYSSYQALKVTEKHKENYEGKVRYFIQNLWMIKHKETLHY